MSDSPALLVERHDAVCTISLNNAPMNPIGGRQVEALEQLLPELAVDVSVRAIVIKGGGDKHFSVGANLTEEHSTENPASEEFTIRRVALFNPIEGMKKPVIAAIKGYCLGGGMELALSCHFRIAEEGAKLGLPEVNLGLAPMWSGPSRILRLVGRANALELMLSGDRISAARAHSIGLVNKVVSAEMFEQTVNELATMLSEKPPLSVAAIIQFVYQSQDLTRAESLQKELDLFKGLLGTKDNIEGVSALFKKRKPVFIGE